MTILLSLWYLGLVLAAGLAYRWLGRRLGSAGRLVRPVLLIALSLAFLAKFLSLTHYLPYFAAYVAAVVAAAWGLERVPAARRAWPAAAFITGLAAVMLAFKYPHLTGLLIGVHEVLTRLSAVEWIGLSYTTFRAVDLLLHVRSGRGHRFRPVDGIAYLTFFPPFIAGPINRFAPFVKDQDAGPAPLSRDDIRAMALRLSIGVVKIVVLSRLAWYWSIPALPQDLIGVTPGQAVLGLYAYFLYIYFEFSGYTDIVIVTGRLFGIAIPENFRSPLLAPNIQEFWNRWQISLSQWCRDYIFYTLVRRLAGAGIAMLPASIAAIIATFLFIGSWHGDALNWVLYGLYHGLGLAGWMVWRQGLRRFCPEVGDRLDASPIWRVAATLLTFHFVTLGLLLSLAPDHIHRVIGAIVG